MVNQSLSSDESLLAHALGSIPRFATQGTSQGYISDALLVDLNNAYGDNNKCGYVTSQSINMPECWWGVRDVLYYNSTHAFVRIIGFDYNSHAAEWLNVYVDGVWTGWQKLSSQTKLATIKITNIRVTSRSYTQCSVKHGLTASKIIGITPYVDGYPMCVATHCWIDGDYIKWNVSNMNYVESAIATVTVGADVRYLT